MRKFILFIHFFACLLAIICCGGKASFAKDFKIYPSPKVKVKLDEKKRIEADRYLYKSVFALIMDKRDSSLIYIKNSLNINPQNPAAYYQWFRIESEGEQIKNARYAISAAYYLDSTNISYILDYAKVTFDMGDYVRSNKCFLRLEKIQPSHHSALLGQLDCAYYSGKNDLALALINRINERDEYNDLVFRYHYTILLSKNKDLAEELASTYFKKFQSLTPALILAQTYLDKDLAVTKYWLDNAEAIDPNNEDVLMTKIHFYEKTNNDSSKLKLVYNILTSNEFSPKLKLDVYDDLVYEKSFSNKYKSLIDSLFHKETFLNDSYKFKYLLSNWNILMDIGPQPDQFLRKQIVDFEADTALYNTVKMQFSKNNFIAESGFLLDMYTLIMKYSLSKDNLGDVISYANSALVLYPRNYISYYYLGLAFLKQGKKEEVISSFTMAINLTPRNSDMKARALSILGDIYAEKDEFLTASNYYEKAIFINPNDVSALNNYAYYLANHNEKLPKALEFSKKAIAAEPQNVNLLDTYAWILYKMEKYDLAVEEYKKILKMEIDPSVEILEHYADVLKKIGDLDNAKIYSERASSKRDKPNLSENKR